MMQSIPNKAYLGVSDDHELGVRALFVEIVDLVGHVLGALLDGAGICSIRASSSRVVYGLSS